MNCINKKQIKENEIIENTYYIVDSFDNITEKECLRLDKINEKIYKKLLKRVKTAEKTVKNTGLHISLDTPILPKPTNAEKFNIWKKRNVERHVILQSEAVIFLQEKGYKLNEHYEAYQAIELHKEILKNSNASDNTLKSLEMTKDFNDIFTKNDSNILRRRSIYGNKHFINDNKKIINSNLESSNKDKSLIINDFFSESDNPSSNQSYFNPAPSAPPPPTNDNINYEKDISKNLSKKNEENKNQNSLYPSINEF